MSVVKHQLVLIAVMMLLGGVARAETRTSHLGRYVVRLDPHPRANTINRWLTWRIHVSRADGKPVVLKDVDFDGGMPEHGHGLATRPKVAAEGHDNFVIEGLRFQMAGFWRVRVLLVDEQGLDAADFDLVIGTADVHFSASWTESDMQVLRSLSISNLPAPPADDPNAVALGQLLFFDAGLSRDGKTACSTCHVPEKFFADGLPTQPGQPRNTPTVVGASQQPFQFWDGRRDSLWSQAIVPLEAGTEMNNTRAGVLQYLRSRRDYAEAYNRVFGPLPNIAHLPKQAGPLAPGPELAAWNKLGAREQLAITRVLVNVGKAIAAYERQLQPGRSPFDDYVDALQAGDITRARTLLSPLAERGLKIFMAPQAQCLQCHNGPMFTNHEFQQVGTGTVSGPSPDFGRVIGVQALSATEFGCQGPFADASQRPCRDLQYMNQHSSGSAPGAFKVPSLRTAAQTAPYAHDGRFANLEAAIEHYHRPRAPQTPLDFRPIPDMSPHAIQALASFIASLQAPVNAPAPLLQAPVAHH